MKTPLLVEIIGDTGVGKTHFASLFPSPFMIDTTPKGEARSVFLKASKQNEINYTRARNWDEVKNCIKIGGTDNAVKTLIIDDSTELQRLATPAYLASLGKPRKQALQIEYGHIRDFVDVDVIFKVTAEPPTGYGKNLVCTSKLKDLYKTALDSDGKQISWKEGKQRDGYARLDYQSDLRFLMTIAEGSPPTRQIAVAKNRFLDKVNDSAIWKSVIKGTWEDVKSLCVGETLVE